MTFYLKYRPKNLDELDLKDVSESLKKIVSSDNIPHAFLFAGSKGTGKTSAARILAKIINCLAKRDPALQDEGIPCDKCEQCLSITKGNNLDVIEMDAASNRGIDDVRNLKESIKLSPTASKKKIYIIDEAHMLTTEASNALLKTLEEPPEHVIFILATTNPEKLIDTIRSRATLIKFRKATEDEIISSLKRVVDGEKIKVSDKTLEEIAKNSNGAFRDAVKSLEQINLEGEENFNKNNSSDSEFIKNLFSKKADECLKYVEKISSDGASIELLIKTVLGQIQSEIMNGNNELIALAELLITANQMMKDSPIEQLPLEIAIIKWSGEVKKNEFETPQQQITEVVKEVIREEIKADFDDKDMCPAEQDLALPEQKFDNEIVWKKILSDIKPINASIEALLRSSKPLNYNGNTLTLGVYYKFHKERLEEASHRKILEGVITRVLNNETKIMCTLLDTPIIAPLTEDKDQDIIKVAEEIFS